MQTNNTKSTRARWICGTIVLCLATALPAMAAKIDDNPKVSVIAVDEAKEKKTMADEIKSLNKGSTRYGSLKKVQPKLAFTAGSFDYVPKGYELEGYRLYNDETGRPLSKNNKYLQMNFYKDGKPNDFIYVQARLMDEETEFEEETGEGVRETKINGHKALVSDRSVDLYVDDVCYMITVGEKLSAGEAVKMAKSLSID